jgi:hypothetical protein
MKRSLWTFGWLLAGAVGGFSMWGNASSIPEAHAGEPAAQRDVTGPSCLIKGTYPPAKNTKVFDQTTGGDVIASFSGAYLPMTLLEIPFDPSTFRARLATSTGTNNVRLEGFVSLNDWPLFTTTDISVQGAAVWISAAQKVKIVRATADSLTVEMNVGGTLNQTVRATAPCDAFSLAKGKPQPLEFPKQGRSYMTKKPKVDLYEEPKGRVVFTLNMMEGTGLLFWGEKVRQGFVHVISRNDLTIDAWIPQKDLEALKKSEMMEQYTPQATPISGSLLQFDKPPPVAKATQPIPIRAKRDDTAKPIGFIETGAEFYVLETVTTWTNIMPKSLGVLPPDDGGFWIPSAEVPK